MDGVHDLGGRQGFGPIATQEDERPFKTDWEARMWGLNKAIGGDPDWNDLEAQECGDPHDHNRDCEPDAAFPLLSIPTLHFVSLLFGRCG